MADDRPSKHDSAALEEPVLEKADQESASFSDSLLAAGSGIRQSWLSTVIRELQVAVGALECLRFPPHIKKERLMEIAAGFTPPANRIESLLLRGLVAEAGLKCAASHPECDTPLTAAEKVVKLLAQRYVEQWTLDRISREVARHKSLLTGEFKRAFGCTIHEFLARVRIAAAKRLLVAGSLKVEAVGVAVGYRSKKSFYREFIRMTGMRPSAFRRMRQERLTFE